MHGSGGDDFVKRDELHPAGIILVILPVLFFNLFLGSYSWFPRYEFYRIFIPLPEASLAALFYLLIAGLRKRQLHSQGQRSIVLLLLSVFTLIFLALFAFTTAESFFQHIYQRSFDIKANVPLAASFFNMIFTTDLFSRPLFIMLPAALAGGALFILFLLLFRKGLLWVRAISGPLHICFALGLFILSLFLVSPPSPALILADQCIRPAGAVPEDIVLPRVEPPEVEEPASAADQSYYSLPGLQDPHIHLFIVESYGMTIFTNPHHKKRLAEFFPEQYRLLREEGFYVFSSAYDSTTFGGTSWLADAALLTGIDIHTQALYDRVVKGGTRNLLHVLSDKGYRTVLSAPGTHFMTEEYMEFYSFDDYITFEDFGYEGPYFCYGDMPDQYQLYHVFNTALGPERDSGKPVFIEYILCSSHVPWNYIPPYIESWSGFEKGKVYQDKTANTWYENSWVAGSELFEGYTHSIRYSLETVFGYAHRYLTGNDLLILVGDHQPKFPVSEKNAGFGVPIHIIARNRGILLPLKRFGYKEGLIPPEIENLAGLEEFLGHFYSMAGFPSR